MEGDRRALWNSVLFLLLAGFLGAMHAISAGFFEKVIAAASAGLLSYPLSKWRPVQGFRSAVLFSIAWAILAYLFGGSTLRPNKLDVALTLTTSFTSLYGFIYSTHYRPKEEPTALKKAIPILLPTLMGLIALYRRMTEGDLGEGYLTSVSLDAVGMAVASYLVGFAKMEKEEGEEERVEVSTWVVPTLRAVNRLMEEKAPREALIKATTIVEAVLRIKARAPLGLDWAELIKGTEDEEELASVFETRDAAVYGGMKVSESQAKRASLAAMNITRTSFHALRDSSKNEIVLRVVSTYSGVQLTRVRVEVARGRRGAN